jgi:hypothetical protein
MRYLKHRRPCAFIREEEGMQPIYVSELFRLLDFIGHDSKAVAKSLGAPRTPLSLWKHGRRPIARAYEAPLVRYTIEAVNQALATAKAQDRITEGRSLLDRRSSAVDFEVEVWDFVDRWERELLQTTDALDQEFRRWLEVLMQYRQRDLSKHEGFDLSRIGYAAKRIQQCVSELFRQHGDQAGLVALHGYVPGPRLLHGPETPAERIAELARWAGIHLETDA